MLQCFCSHLFCRRHNLVINLFERLESVLLFSFFRIKFESQLQVKGKTVALKTPPVKKHSFKINSLIIFRLFITCKCNNICTCVSDGFVGC